MKVFCPALAPIPGVPNLASFTGFSGVRRMHPHRRRCEVVRFSDTPSSPRGQSGHAGRFLAANQRSTSPPTAHQ